MAAKRIILHGYLQDLWPEAKGELVFEADTIAEAVNALCRVTGGAFSPTLSEGKHEVRVLGVQDSNELFVPTDQEEIHLLPGFAGGKSSGGFIKIAIGAILIAIAIYFMPPAGIALAEGFVITPMMVGAFGGALILGGILEVMSPAPKNDFNSNSGEDPEESKYLGAPRNTVKIGTRIPIGYGRHKVYGHFLSFNIDAKEIAL